MTTTTKKPPGRAPDRPTSEACRKLRHLLTLDAPTLIGIIMGVERETVMEYSRSRRRPIPQLQPRLECLGIPASDWKTPPTFDPAAQPPVGAA